MRFGATHSARVLGATLAVCSGSFAACSLTSLSGFSGGTTDARDADGADADRADTSPDGSLPGDGGADGSAPLGYCESLSPKPTFCDDFERTTLLGPWESDEQQSGGSIVVEPSTRSDTGRELHANLPFYGSGVPASGQLLKKLPTAGEVTYGFAYRTDSPLPANSNAVQTVALVVSIGVSGDYFALYLMTRPTGVTLVEQAFPAVNPTGGAFAEHVLGQPVLYGVWQRVDVQVKLTSPPHITASIDGKVAYSASANSFLQPGVVELNAGIHYAEPPAGPLSIRIDDLFVDVK